MTGTEIKQLILKNGLHCWQIADKLGMNDGNFSRRLRKPFTEEETERIRAIISELTAKAGV